MECIKVGMYNYTVPAHVTGVSGQMSKWHPPDIAKKENWVRYNPHRANEILDSIGYFKNDYGIRETKTGEDLYFNIIIVSGWSDWIRSAQIISKNLEQIGIKTKVKTYYIL